MDNNALTFEIARYVESNRSYFEADSLNEVKQLIFMSHKPMSEFYGLKFKSPIFATVISVVLGAFGIDRFYTGNYIMGIIKLLTSGGCGIWYFADWYLIGKAVKQKNLETLRAFAQGSEIISNKEQNVEKNVEFEEPSKDVLDAFKDIAQTMDAE